jgi:hypothetical protein
LPCCGHTLTSPVGLAWFGSVRSYEDGTMGFAKRRARDGNGIPHCGLRSPLWQHANLRGTMSQDKQHVLLLLLVHATTWHAKCASLAFISTTARSAVSRRARVDCSGDNSAGDALAPARKNSGTVCFVRFLQSSSTTSRRKMISRRCSAPTRSTSSCGPVSHP